MTAEEPYQIPPSLLGSESQRASPSWIYQRPKAVADRPPCPTPGPAPTGLPQDWDRAPQAGTELLMCKPDSGRRNPTGGDGSAL